MKKLIRYVKDHAADKPWIPDVCHEDLSDAATEAAARETASSSP